MADYSDYTVSVHYDQRLYRHDIAGSLAHVRMLAKRKLDLTASKVKELPEIQKLFNKAG